MIETISDDDVQRFLDDGAITVDTALFPESIRAGAATIDARLARAGQASIVTTGMVRIDLPVGQEIQRRRYLQSLAERLSPPRRHIAWR